MFDNNSPALTKEDGINFTLRDIVAPLFRRARLCAIVFAVVFLIAAWFGLSRLHKYESHMAILVRRERADPIVTTESTSRVDSTLALTDQEVNSEAELLKSRDLLEQVVRDTGMDNPSQRSWLRRKIHAALSFVRPERSEADRVAIAVRSMASQIQVETPAKTNLIEVTYGSSDPGQAYAVLQSLSNLYLDKHAMVHRAPGSYEFFAQQAQSYKSALDNAEEGLRSFAKQQGVSNAGEQRTDMATQVSVAMGQTHAIEQQIAADQQRIQSLQKQIKETPQRSTTRQDVQSASLLLQNLGTALLTAETRRTQLLLKYAPDYPLVQEADQEVAQAKAAIAEAQKNPYVNQSTDRDPTFELLREELAKDEADLAGQRAALAANQHGIETMRAQMVKLGSQSLDEADLQREAKQDEENYLLYVSKREQERTSNALDRTRIENVAIAVPPAIPVLPTYSLVTIGMLAFALAFIISIPATYIVDYLDPSFHTPAQVADILGIPVVVAVPKRTA